MGKRSDSDQLDDALDIRMTDPDAPLPGLHPRLAALLRLAGDLRGLPSATFKAQLKADLLAAADPAARLARYGKSLATPDDIDARLRELAAAPRFVAHDLRDALRDLPEMTMRFLASLNACTVGVSRFSDAPSHWERHPAGDELLHILDGETDVVTLTDAGSIRSTAPAGSLFICPQGLWHRLEPRSSGAMLFATPGAGTEHSGADDPRGQRRGRRSSAPALLAHDLHAVLRDLPELRITAETTDEEAHAAMRPLTTLGPCTLGVVRYSGLHPWERHPGGDELLHALAGAVDITVLTDDGPRQTTLRAGSIFVCPRGLWHRPIPRPAVTLLFGTPAATTEVSFADDPRQQRD
jgi:quercetin dioxygenase-like cupin family protein